MSEIILLGYGNQGRAWALNLRDSGWKVTVSGRSPEQGGKGIARARSDGFPTLGLAEIEALSRVPLAILLPDHEIPQVFAQWFADPQRAPRVFLFAHGFSVTYGGLNFLEADDVILVAPKGIGVRLRELFVQGSGVMGVLGVEQDGSGQAWSLAKRVGEGLGCDRVELVRSSFREETNADLLSEQAILCGILPRLVAFTANFLARKGIDRRIANYECIQETNLIADMMSRKGILGMYNDVSPTARFGGLRAAERLLPDSILEQGLESLWQDIVAGRFADEFRREVEAGQPVTQKVLAAFPGEKETS
jgi:ketol-acid reductoisomerase